MRKRLGIIALVLGVILDVVLVLLAIRHVQPDEAPEGVAVPSSADPSPSSGSPSAEKSEPPASPSTATYLSVDSDGSFLRARRGSCAENVSPIVEISMNAGQEFERVTVADDLSEVLRVQSNGEHDMRVIGTDANCEPNIYATSDAGRTWTRTPGTVSFWHLLPNQSRSAIHAPGGTVPLPCPPMHLSTLEAGVVRALCQDGTIIGTVDNGQSWLILGQLEDAAAIRWTSPTQAYALASVDDCRSAVLQTSDGGRSWDRLVCLGTARPMAFDASDAVIAAQVDSELRVSFDGGNSWEAR